MIDNPPFLTPRQFDDIPALPRPRQKGTGPSSHHMGSLDDASWRPLREEFLDVAPCGGRHGEGIVEFSTLRRGGLWRTGIAGSMMSSAARKDGPPDYVNAWSSSPRIGALFVWRRFTEPGQTARGVHTALCSGGNWGDLAGVRDES